MWHDKALDLLMASISDDKAYVVVPYKLEAYNNVFVAADGDGVDSIRAEFARLIQLVERAARCALVEGLHGICTTLKAASRFH